MSFFAVGLAVAVGNGVTGGTTTPTATRGSFERLVVASPLVGTLAPEFTVTDPADPKGPAVSLKDLRTGDRPVVLFFNGGAGCGTCVAQMEKLSRAFSDGSVRVASIVSSHTDPVEEWAKIVVKYPVFKNTVLIDEDGIVSKGYGALQLPSSVGHGGGHAPGHSYFVIDREGVVRLVADDQAMGDWTAKIEEFVRKL